MTRKKLYRSVIAFLLSAFIVLFVTSCGNQEPSSNGPSIGITYGQVQMKMKKFCIDVNNDYVEAVRDNGGNAVEITINDPEIVIQEKLHTLDGVLIPGGLDVHPSRYNENEYEKLEAVDKELDALEFTVLEYARKNKLPVLGICRGCQILNVFYGGSLYQDIPTQFESDKTIQHRDQLDLVLYTHSVACYHEVNLSNISILHDILDRDSLEVNTYHHQAVKDLAPGFVVNARSVDGLVEGIERRGGPFILGTQFHPEKMREDRPVFNSIFVKFIQAASN